MLLILAALSTGLGLVITWQLDVDAPRTLMLVASMAGASGIAFSLHDQRPGQSMAAGAIVAAASVALAWNLPSLQGAGSLAAVWLLLLGGIVYWSRNNVPLAQYSLAASATLSFGIPLLSARSGTSAPAVPVQAIAAATACVAFAIALGRFALPSGQPDGDRNATDRRIPRWIPNALLWTITGFVAVAAAVSIERTWTALALLTVSAAMLCDCVYERQREPIRDAVFPNRLVLVAGVASAASGAALVVGSLMTGHPFGWPVAGLAVVALASLVSLGKESMDHAERYVSHLRTSSLASRIDPLTELLNRRGFDERLKHEIARTLRYNHPMSLLLIDVDDFKRVNDLYGHGIGDQALRSIAAAIDGSIRSIDIAGRYGGEEFAVLLPETPLEGAAVVADRIRSAVAEGAGPVHSTVSVGVAVLAEEDASPASLLERADTALYRAKSLGKNRVELTGEITRSWSRGFEDTQIGV